MNRFQSAFVFTQNLLLSHDFPPAVDFWFAYVVELIEYIRFLIRIQPMFHLGRFLLRFCVEHNRIEISLQFVCLSITPIISETIAPIGTTFDRKVGPENRLACSE